ncbi:MAG: NAD(P)/FAD-dependent oxidoreductase [Candidatus Woesearchaeota archaeon]
MRVVIIGGGSAGTTCAYELRKLDKDVEITLVEKTADTEYSPCALPYVLSGEIPSFDHIYIFKKEDYEQNAIRLMLDSHVKAIDRNAKKAVLADGEELPYDALVLATGSKPSIPPIQGLDQTRFYCLKTIEDAKRISETIRPGKKSVVVGAGMIGVELADALASKEEDVTLIETQEHILPDLLDEDMSRLVAEILEAKGVKIYTRTSVNEATPDKVRTHDKEIPSDKLFICAGVKPDTRLAREAGLETDKGVLVDATMRTTDENIFACGDCVESHEQDTGRKVCSQLGTTAVRQAKTVAENVLGGKKEFPPVVNNTISKIGGVYVGAVGLTGKRASDVGFRTVSARYTSGVRAEYHPSEERITIKLVCDETGKVVGGQAVGDDEVAGRLDLISLAIRKGVRAGELAELETCYNPASAPIFDPLTIAAGLCAKKQALSRR